MSKFVVFGSRVVRLYQLLAASRWLAAALVVAFSLLVAPASNWSDDHDEPLTEITAITVDGDAIRLDANRSLKVYEPFSSLKLMNPHRLVVDLPNATLTGKAKALLGGKPAKTLPLKGNGLQELMIQQTDSPFYQSVRLMVVAKDYDTLNRLQFTTDGKAGHIGLVKAGQLEKSADKLVDKLDKLTKSVMKPAVGQPQQATPATTSAEIKAQTDKALATYPKTTAVVTNVHYEKGQLRLVTDPSHAPLRAKQQFTLTNPSRLVLDFGPASLAHRGLSSTIAVGDDPNTTNMRIGQFDADTIRVVIETRTPERFTAYFSNAQKDDLQQVVISANSGLNPNQLPSGTTFTTIDRIGLDALPGGGAVIRIKTQTPLVHRWLQEDNQIVAQLLNVPAEPGEVSFEAQKFPMIRKMAVTPLGTGQPNSQFVITLDPTLAKKDGWRITTDVEENGSTLAIRLQPELATTAPSGKLPSGMRVVVDAGHGGKDVGANRAGVLEKNLTLAIALKLRAALQARGVAVHMTRDTDEFLPLSTITAITNAQNPDAFVSVHINASTNPAINGIETYYYHGRSVPLAQAVHRAMVGSQKRPDRGTRQARFYVINHTPVPAILCEVGYISHTGERQALTDPQVQASIATAIANGVVAYLSGQK